MPRALTSIACILTAFLAGLLAGSTPPLTAQTVSEPDGFSLSRLGERLQELERQSRNLTERHARVTAEEQVDGIERERRQLEEDLDFLELALHREGSTAAEVLLGKLERVRHAFHETVLRPEASAYLSTWLRNLSSVDAVGEGAWVGQVSAVTGSDSCRATPAVGLGTYSGTTTGATNDGAASCGAASSSRDLWFKFVAPATGRIFLDTIGSDFDTVLSVHGACPGVVANQLACDDDTLGLQSALSVNVSAGGQYWVRVAGFADAAGVFMLHVTTGLEILGTVKDAESGLPLESVTLKAYGASGQLLAVGSSGVSGRYSLGPLGIGTYTVEASLSNRVPEFFDDMICSQLVSPFCHPSIGTPIVIDGSASVDGVDFNLDRPGQIRGRVTDSATGSPLPAARVQAITDPFDFARSTLTNAAGDFTVSGLLAGNYFLVADDGEYSPELYRELPCRGGITECAAGGMPVAVALSSSTEGIDFTLARLGAIEGRVSAMDGTPLSFVTVRVFDDLGQQVSSNSTSAAGGYRIGGLEAGNYYVVTTGGLARSTLYDALPCSVGSLINCDPRTGTPVIVPIAATVQGIDFRVDLLGSVKGRVTAADTGEPIVDKLLEVSLQNESHPRTVSPDADGEYVVRGLLPGTYYVRTQTHFPGSSASLFVDELFDNLPCASGCDVNGGTAVRVDYNRSVTGVDFALDRLGSISGSVTAATTGAPISGVRVEARSPGGFLTEVTQTNTSGAYIVERLPAGNYLVRTSGASGFRDELFDDIPCIEVGCENAATLVGVALNTTTSAVDFALDRLGSISGTVVDGPSGEPLPGVRVMLHTPELSHPIPSTTTDSSGSYTFVSLIAGRYLARTELSLDDPHIAELYDDVSCFFSCPNSSGTPIIVSLNTTTRVDFVLDRGGVFTGRIVSERSGEPIAGLRVIAASLELPLSRSAVTDSSGHFEINRLLGRYAVFSAGTEVVNELFDDIPCAGACLPADGRPLVATLNGVTSGIDLSLRSMGSIEGVLLTTTGEPITATLVRLFDDERFQGDRITDAAGRYTFSGLDAGAYFVATDSREFVNQVFDGLFCGEGPLRSPGCEAMSGTPIPVVLDCATTGVDFALQHRGSISGQVVVEATRQPLFDATVSAFNADGIFSFSATTDSSGRYVVQRLLPGVHFLRASPGFRRKDEFIPELYDGIQCVGSCNVTKGTPIEVTIGSTTTNIDFHLIERFSGIAGTVGEHDVNHPLAAVPVDVWDASGVRVGRVLTSRAGSYLVRLNRGTYFLSTDLRGEHPDEIYDDIPCPAGSAAAGGCDPTTGAPVIVLEDTLTEGINVVLGGASLIFGDGFESGDASAWARITR